VAGSYGWSAAESDWRFFASYAWAPPNPNNGVLDVGGVLDFEASAARTTGTIPADTTASTTAHYDGTVVDNGTISGGAGGSTITFDTLWTFNSQSPGGKWIVTGSWRATRNQTPSDNGGWIGGTFDLLWNPNAAYTAKYTLYGSVTIDPASSGGRWACSSGGGTFAGWATPDPSTLGPPATDISGEFQVLFTRPVDGTC